MAPNHLTHLLPPERRETVQYALRNNTRIEPPFTRLECYRRSFIPYAIRLWNSLDSVAREVHSIREFKLLLDTTPDINPLFYYGKRWSNIHHARLRMGCSGLKYDLYTNVHVVDSPYCSCENVLETAYHYLMTCPKYTLQRAVMRTQIEQICEFHFNTLLYGNELLSLEDNELVFDAVHSYFRDTKRFI